MASGTDIPDSVERLSVWLLDHGFQLVSDRRGGMGGALLTFTGQIGLAPPAWIEVSGDRGHWAIRLRFDGMTQYVAAQVWAAHLDNVNIGESDVDQQAAFIEDRLDDAALAFMANPGIETELVRLGEEYMRGKYPNLFKE